MFKWIFRIFFSAMIVAVVVFAVRPGPYRAIAPTWFGTEKIAPRIYTDAPARSAKFIALVRSARKPVADFFGPLQTDPIHIFCTTQTCADQFGLKTAGMNLGFHANIYGPTGINTTIVTHELSHTELHRTLGVTDIFNPRFPSWFDEGLASYLSKDSRLVEDPDPDWIKVAHTLRDWKRLTTRQTWRRNYSASWTLIKDVADERGVEALQTLVRQVEAGADFHPLWEALETQP